MVEGDVEFLLGKDQLFLRLALEDNPAALKLAETRDGHVSADRLVCGSMALQSPQRHLNERLRIVTLIPANQTVPADNVPTLQGFI